MQVVCIGVTGAFLTSSQKSQCDFVYPNFAYQNCSGLQNRINRVSVYSQFSIFQDYNKELKNFAYYYHAHRLYSQLDNHQKLLNSRLQKLFKINFNLYSIAIKMIRNQFYTEFILKA